MNGKPLLSETWRDIIAVGSFVVTVVGFALAYRQLRKTRSAAVAALDATSRVFQENRRQYQRFILANVVRFLVEAKAYVVAERWELAALRLRDMADQVSQIADSDSSWVEILSELRRLETSIAANPNAKFSGRKWSTLISRLQSKIDLHHGPYKEMGE